MRLGRGHSLVRRIRALRRDARTRRSEGVLVAEGLHLGEEALAARARVELAVFSAALAERADGRRLLERLRAAAIPCHETSPELLVSLQDARSPQPLLLVVERPHWTLEHCLAKSARTVVVAHAIQDPGNLGAILRTAAAAGADALLACGESADLYHPRTVRAGMGASFRLPAVATDLSCAVERLRAGGLRLVGADPGASCSYLDGDLGERTALLLGGEGAGLPAELRHALDETVRIPMRSGANSLSVGAAAAVLLFELARRRA